MAEKNKATCAIVMRLRRLKELEYCVLGTVIILSRASERKFSRGYEGRYRAPKSYWAPQALSGAHTVKSFFVGWV